MSKQREMFEVQKQNLAKAHEEMVSIKNEIQRLQGMLVQKAALKDQLTGAVHVLQELLGITVDGFLVEGKENEAAVWRQDPNKKESEPVEATEEIKK